MKICTRSLSKYPCFDSIRKIWTGQTVYATTTAAAGQITGDQRSRGTLRSTHSNPRPSCTHKHTITLRVDSVHPWTRYSVPLLKEYYHKLNDIPKCRRVMHQVTTESNRKQPQATASYPASCPARSASGARNLQFCTSIPKLGFEPAYCAHGRKAQTF